MAGESTKQRLLEVGKLTFLERGYGNSGIETILHAAGVPKGSFYHYFKSKEDFGLQVLDHFANCYDELMNQSLGNVTLSPISRFRCYFEGAADRFDQDHCRKGCLVGNLSQELADQSESFRMKLEEIFHRWEGRYAECLSEAVDMGDISPVLPVSELAVLWLNGWQGAMLRAKSARSSAPLRNFLAVMFLHVLRVQSPARDIAQHSTGPARLGRLSALESTG